MDKWLILDRDGVINCDSDHFIKSPKEWEPLPGSLEAIAQLNMAGYRIVVISNQSGLARGLFDIDTLTSIHNKFVSMLDAVNGSVEKIYYCPHGPEDQCDCRKPRAGMFKQFAEEYEVSLKNVFAVGDSIRDLEAANRAGAKSILVQTGKGERSIRALQELDEHDAMRLIPIYADLASFTHALLSEDDIS